MLAEESTSLPLVGEARSDGLLLRLNLPQGVTN